MAEVSLDAKMVQEASKTHVSELFYQKCVAQSNSIYQEEKARQLRLQILLLEDDKDDLHAQLLQSDYRIEDLETWLEDIQVDSRTFSKEAEQLRGELRLKNREVENLKAELDSLQSVSMDSTKLLTEKLALCRELAALRPEVEHLRSQAASSQALLAEKLALQRQVGTLQVELETERRSTQRALSREEGKQERDAKLEAQVDELQAELAKERKERQKTERESQKVVAEFESKKNILEARLDAFRNKLRMTKDQLKETQTELQTARAAVRAHPAKNANTVPGNPRKRSLAQFDPDATIGTPGLFAAAKRNKRSTLPGEKSTFSITPFLNRTKSIAPESPANDQPAVEDRAEASADMNTEAQKDPTDVDAETPSVLPAQKGKTKEVKTVEPLEQCTALSTATSQIANAKKAPKRTAKSIPALEQVQEEDNDENIPPVIAQVVAPAPIAKAVPKLKMKVFEGGDHTYCEEPTILRKARILGGGLGKTLFDEEEEGGKAIGRGLFGGAQSLAALRGPLGKTSRAGGLGGSNAGFGAFSPLKKDRKKLVAA